MGEQAGILELHHAFNLESAGRWDTYEGHRSQVMQAILENSDGNARAIGILGAGNCNDLELAALSERFDSVHLVDLDIEAMRKGVIGQRMQHQDNIFLHPVEFSGIYKKLEEWTEHPPSTHEVDELCDVLNHGGLTPNPTGGVYDVTVSLCTQSQISWSIKQAGLSPEQEFRLILAARNAHILFVLFLLRKRGMGILVNDLTSFGTEEGWGKVSCFDLLNLMERVIDSRSFFVGNNPRAIIEVLHSHPSIKRHAHDISLLPPWFWNFSSDTLFLVYALRFRKS